MRDKLSAIYYHLHASLSFSSHPTGAGLLSVNLHIFDVASVNS